MSRARLSIAACQLLVLSSAVLLPTVRLAAQIVPGTGTKLNKVGDDFEDEKWKFNFNAPKCSYDIDKQSRYPLGDSANKRWFEGPKRGYPDVVKRVATPPGGLDGSQGALLLQTLHSGVPGYSSGGMGQDDYIADVTGPMGGELPVRLGPSMVVRVFLPPVKEWEPRNGPTLGIRLGLKGPAPPPPRKRSRDDDEPHDGSYWPGIFIHYNAKDKTGKLVIRGNDYGGDFNSKAIEQTGWWTFGMSVTPNGQVHYYAHPGVEDLTPEDRLASQFPYGTHCLTFGNFFFDVCNQNDGRTWSTPWIIDDASVYLAYPDGHIAGRR